MIILIDKWNKFVNNGGAFAASFTDLFNKFDSLSHELLIVKLDVYGFDKNRLLNSYVTNKKQRLKVNGRYISCTEILLGIPRDSNLVPF